MFSIQHISHNAKFGLNAPMEIKEIRRENLLVLLEEFGTATSLASAAGTDAAYISQIKSKKTKREIGDNLARRLEKAGGKTRGWMDQLHRHQKEAESHGGGALNREERVMIDVIRQLHPKERTRFWEALHSAASALGVRVKKKPSQTHK